MLNDGKLKHYCLKTKGFNLEDTHLTDHERISKLFALLTITFAWVGILIWLGFG